MIQTWFKIFYRNSKKNWLNLFINILGLTLGFAGLLLVLLYLNDEESYNATNPHKEEVYRVVHLMHDGDVWESSTVVEGPKFKEDIPEVIEIYMSDGWYDDYVVNTGGKNVYTRNIVLGGNTFFDFFPFKITQGSLADFKKGNNNVAISEKQAKIYFGDKSPIGKSLEFDNNVFQITTVYKLEGKHYFLPNIVYQYTEKLSGNWGSFSKTLFLKVKKGTKKEELTQKLNTVFYDNTAVVSSKKEGITPEEWFKKWGTKILIEPLTEIRLKSIGQNVGPEGKGNYELIMIMLSISILLIIISCVNFINLSTASATQRAKEVGVKKTLGLTKTKMMRQFTLEIVLQGFVSFLFSLLLVELFLPYFNQFLNKDISILQGNVLFKVVVIALLVSIFIGIIPAVYLANFKSVEVLKGNISRSKNGVFARNIMLGLQFLISGFFLIGSLVMYNQVNYMMQKKLGFSGEQVLSVMMHSVDWRQRDNTYKKYELAKKELIKHPNIKVVTSNYFLPGGGSSNSTNVDFQGKSVQANANFLDFEVLKMLKIKLLKGRDFNAEIASDTIKNIIINETMAKSLGIYDDPIGKKINLGYRADDNDGKNMNIIGMVKDYHIYGFQNKIPPVFFIHWNTFDWTKGNFRFIQFKISPENIDVTIKHIENYWKKNVEQGYPFEYRFLDKQFARTYKRHHKNQQLFFVLTSIVIIISLLGLFALATLTIQQRLKEVAIRKTLGASVQEIMVELIKSFIKIVLISSVFLIPIAYYFMQNWLDDFVYRIDMPILPYIITPLILIILVIAVVGLKAYNATKVDLIKYLKFE